jgi:hypothetical protein
MGELRDDADLEGWVQATIYPNSPGSEDPEDFGHWDLTAFQAETRFQQIVSWVQSACRVWQGRSEVDGGAPSGMNTEFAATTELAIEELHPHFNGGQNEYDVRAADITTHSWGNEGNHGLYTVYADTPGMDDIDGRPVDSDVDEDVCWWFVDTTTDEISPVWDSTYSEGGDNVRDHGGNYDPFTLGFETEQDQIPQSWMTNTELGYENRKDSPLAGLFSLVIAGRTEVNCDKVFMTDEFAEEGPC